MLSTLVESAGELQTLWCTVTIRVNTQEDHMGLELGEHLKTVRMVHGLSLRAVAQPAEISVAYLQKLEGGEVLQPSPNVLRRLARALGVSYESLMDLAGYAPNESSDLDPVLGSRSRMDSFASVIDSTDLSEDERRAVAAFIAHLRDQRSAHGQKSASRKTPPKKTRSR
jgi:transcriptional regulator with XRE-family HTH domain